VLRLGRERRDHRPDEQAHDHDRPARHPISAEVHRVLVAGRDRSAVVDEELDLARSAHSHPRHRRFLTSILRRERRQRQEAVLVK